MTSSGGPLNTTITNNHPAILVTFDDNESSGSVLEGFTLLGGYIAVRCIDSGPTIRRNILIGQNAYNWAAIAISGSSSVIIENCTIVNSTNGGISSLSYSNVTITNTIIAFNDTYGIHRQSPSYPVSLSYNNVYGHRADYFNFSDHGVGTISADPLFNTNYTLQAGSPCIDAGDPDMPPDPDGTIPDMGALYYHRASGNKIRGPGD